MEIADGITDSDACAGSKRRVTETPSQDLKEESSSPIQEHMETQLSFFKKVKSSSSSSGDEDHLVINESLSEANEDLGFPQNQEKFDSLSEKLQEEKDFVKPEVGSSAIQEYNLDGDSVGSMDTESETFLVAQKYRLLAQVNELRPVFQGNKSHVEKVLSDGDTVDGIKLIDGDVRRPMKIQVIDDTSLIESVQAPRTGNGCLKSTGIASIAKMTQGNEKIPPVDGKKAKRSKRKVKAMKLVSEMSARLVQDKKDRGLDTGEEVKIMYSREEMEILRFVNIVQQRKLWRDICTGLGPAIMNEYANLATLKRQKPILKSLDPRMYFSSKSEAPGILGVVAARERRNHFNICVH